MFKALISDIAEMAHVQAEPVGDEPVKRVCAYIEAVGACALVACAALLLV